MFGLARQQFDFARQQCAAIASEHIAHMGDKGKHAVLDSAGLVLKRWKHEQADAAGMVEVLRPYGGLLAPVLNPCPERVPVDSVEPHECAGGYIACPSDLLLKLWGDKYPPAVKLADKVGIDVAVAALIERDAMTMPPDSLAYGIRLLWIYTRTNGAVLKAAIEKMRGERETQLAKARNTSKTTRTAGKELQDTKIRSYVENAVMRRPGVDSATLTNELWSKRKEHHITSIRTKNGLNRKVATERTRALKLNAGAQVEEGAVEEGTMKK